MNHEQSNWHNILVHCLLSGLRPSEVVACYVDDEVGTAAAAEHVDLAIASQSDHTSIGDSTGNPVDRRVTSPACPSREEREVAGTRVVGDRQVVEDSIRRNWSNGCTRRGVRNGDPARLT